MRVLGYFFWAAVAGAAGIGLGGIALHRGEHINSLWLVVAAACSYAIGVPLLREVHLPRA